MYLVTTTLCVLKSVRVFDFVEGNGVAALSFSPDGVLLACGGTAGTALVWDWDTGRVRGDEADYRSTITVSLLRCGLLVTGARVGNTPCSRVSGSAYPAVDRGCAVSSASVRLAVPVLAPVAHFHGGSWHAGGRHRAAQLLVPANHNGLVQGLQEPTGVCDGNVFLATDR